MSNRLITEVLECGPRDLSGTELALLIVLADKSGDEDRVVNGRRIPARCCFPGMDQLSAWMRMSPDGVGKVLRKLESRGLQLRVRVGTDTPGRPVYATKGHSTLYRVPELSKGLPAVRPLEDKGLPIVLQWSASRPPKVCQLSDPKPKEPKLTLPPTPRAEPPGPTRAGTATGRGQDPLEELTRDLRGRYPGMAHDEAREIVERCRADPETKEAASRLKQSAYVANVHAAVKADMAAARRAAFAAGAKCEDHTESPAANCPGCLADVKAGDRDPRFIGKHQSECSVPRCWAPIIDQPDGATVCGEHAKAMSEGAA